MRALEMIRHGTASLIGFDEVGIRPCLGSIVAHHVVRAHLDAGDVRTFDSSEDSQRAGEYNVFGGAKKIFISLAAAGIVNVDHFGIVCFELLDREDVEFLQIAAALRPPK